MNGARPILSPMNISWSDLNNLQDAGDYPFRDGTISVTFAEIAIWKKSPDAQFRLMRKHPIQSAFKYVLGRQIEENWAADDAELIYESNNGEPSAKEAKQSSISIDNETDDATAA
jgi:hypothetical protein